MTKKVAEDSLFMKHTTIEAAQTVGEITGLLVQSGAREILMMYNDDMSMKGIKFSLKLPHGTELFILPARVDPVYEFLKEDRPEKNRSKYKEIDQAQAERVAWRQILRWVQAQLSMIKTGMLKAEEVYLPYMERDGKTLYEHVRDGSKFMLPHYKGDNHE